MRPFKFGFIFLIAVLFSLHAQANCNTPVVIVSAANGNFNNPATWQGGVVPEACDFVIINHAVTLNTSITVGQNGNGGLTINQNGSLIGTNTIAVQGGNNYTLTNNGTLQVSQLSLYSGNQGAKFANNGSATINSTTTFDGRSEVINTGSLTVNGTLNLYGSSVLNQTGAMLTVQNDVKVQANSVDSKIDNYGNITINSTTPGQGFYVTAGIVYNRPNGSISMPNNGGFYLSNPSTNMLFNEGQFNVYNMEAHDASIIKNYNTIIVRNNFWNGSRLDNYLGAYLEVWGNYDQHFKTNSYTNIDGFMKVSGNFSNNYFIYGNGGIQILGYSQNRENGHVSGNLDICDTSAPGNNVFDSQHPNGSVASSITKCQYVAPCSSAAPTAIYGQGSPCAGQSGLVYSIPAVPNATAYNWIFPSGWTITSGQGTTSVTVTAGSTSGFVTAEATTTCGNGRKDIMLTPYTLAPAQPGTIMAPPGSTCANQTGFSYSITAVANATHYVWEVPTGWTILTGQGTTSISVATSGTGGQVKVSAANQCDISAPRTLNVSLSSGPGAISAITGSTDRCSNGNSLNYSITAVSGATYLWTAPSGWNIQNPTSNQIQLSRNGNAGSATGNLVVTVSTACGSSSSSLAINWTNGNPGPPTISGLYCNNQTNTITATSANATHYSWTVNSPWTIVSGNGTSSVQVQIPNNVQQNNISVIAYNSCGNTQKSVGVTPIVSPASPASLTGPGTVCEGTNSQFTLSSVTGANSYSWAMPTGWSGSSTSTSLNATVGATSGNVQGWAVASNGCKSPVPATKTVAVSSLPAQPGTITVNSNTYSIAPVAGATSYTWTVPTGWAITSGHNTTSINTTPANTTGNISVTASNSCGTSPASTHTIAPDTDGDGINDLIDEDNNNDGIPDALAHGGNGPLADFDGDGIPDIYDIDIDGDGIMNGIEAYNGLVPNGFNISTGRFSGPVGPTGIPLAASGLLIPDTDYDGKRDFRDLDSDNDGILDNLEGQSTASLTAASGLDSDNDGLDNAYDPSCGCPADGDAIIPVNTDANNIDNPDDQPDYLDLDSDGDYFSDMLEAYDQDGDLWEGSDLMVLADEYGASIGNYSFYDNSVLDQYGFMPTWLEDADYDGIPAFMTPSEAHYYDSNNDGLIDLFRFANMSASFTPADINGNGIPDFRESSISNPLPVTFLSLKGKALANSNILEWRTASEQNSSYFEIERSGDAKVFSTLGSSTAAGNSNQVLTYTFTDKNPLSGINYYRIKQYDTDGSFAYSQTIAVKFENNLEATVYPNPFENQVNLLLSLQKDEKQTVEVTDLRGSRVFYQVINSKAGNQNTIINLENIPAGVYILKVTGSTHQFTQKLIKQ